MDYKEFLEQIVKECNSKADLCRRLDKKPTGGNYRTIDNIIKKYNLDVSHFKNEPWNKGISYYSPKRSLEEILVENSDYTNTTALKSRLFKNGLKEMKCEICGKEEHLELHHVNGDPTDNRLENLQILCIECHSKTDTFRNINGRGRVHKDPKELILSEEESIKHQYAQRLSKFKNIPIRKALEFIDSHPDIPLDELCSPIKQKLTANKEVECPVCHKIFKQKRPEQIYCSQECLHKKLQKSKITKESLINKMIELNCNFTKVGETFNMTDNGIRKWCVKFGLPSRKKEMKEYLEEIKQ